MYYSNYFLSVCEIIHRAVQKSRYILNLSIKSRIRRIGVWFILKCFQQWKVFLKWTKEIIRNFCYRWHSTLNYQKEVEIDQKIGFVFVIGGISEFRQKFISGENASKNSADPKLDRNYPLLRIIYFIVVPSLRNFQHYSSITDQ